MKELSIEEKAKAYDEAKLRMSAAYNSNRCTIGFMNEIFPELKESEEERIKRILLSISSKMSFHLRDIFTEEEFQCFNAWSYAWLKKQGEQKPTDKVEPKFEIGNWVVCGQYGALCQIESIKGGRYYFTSGIGIPIESVNIDYHLWTIQDAKAGDVLVDMCDSLDNPLIFILKDFKHIKHGLATLSDYHSFCYLKASKKQEFCIDGWHNEHNLMPATKEQRNLLFQKMHEAGYEWDSDKKELKKIEQKPANWLQELENKLANATPKQLAEWKEKYFKEEPAEWSEEDVKLLDEMYKFFDTHKIPSLKHDMNDYVKFIKSLKDRVQPQPKQEWNEEDEKRLDNTITQLKAASNIIVNDEVDDSIAFIKSLKDRVQPKPTWRPSDRQMNVLEHYMHTLSCNEHKEILFGLYQDLNKLKESYEKI